MVFSTPTVPKPLSASKIKVAGWLVFEPVFFEVYSFANFDTNSPKLFHKQNKKESFVVSAGK